MTEAKKLGRIVGALLVVQIVLAIPVYTEIGMMRAVIAPGFLHIAAADAAKIRLALLLVALLGTITLLMALVSWPLFRRYSERLALAYVGLSLAGIACELIEATVVRTMVNMSIVYTRGEVAAPVLEALTRPTRAAWSSAHFSNLLLGHVKNMVLFIILMRFRFVPRALAGFGVAAAVLAATAAVLALLGQPFRYPLIMPAGLVTASLAVWLVVRGFRPANVGDR